MIKKKIGSHIQGKTQSKREMETRTIKTHFFWLEIEGFRKVLFGKTKPSVLIQRTGQSHKWFQKITRADPEKYNKSGNGMFAGIGRG